MRRPLTPIGDVSTILALHLRDDIRRAADGNRLVSRTEQARAMPYVRDGAEELRLEAGPNARVTTDALEDHLHDEALRLIGAVNQPSGRGASYLSRSEARRAFRQGGRIGEEVLRAYEVASGNGLNVDELARLHVTHGVSPDTVFKTFATESEAMSYVDPHGRSVVWLVPVEDNLLRKRFVAGRNDLWTQRFEINRLSGTLTILDEH